MASTRRKAAAAGLAVIGIAGLSLAAAAQLNVDNTTLQAGSTSISAACDVDGTVVMDYDYGFNAGAYTLSAVNVTGVDSNCDGKIIEATLVPATGAAVVLTGKTITGATGDVTVSWSGTDLNGATIATINNVAVVIHS